MKKYLFFARTIKNFIIDAKDIELVLYWELWLFYPYDKDLKSHRRLSIFVCLTPTHQFFINSAENVIVFVVPENQDKFDNEALTCRINVPKMNK